MLNELSPFNVIWSNHVGSTSLKHDLAADIAGGCALYRLVADVQILLYAGSERQKEANLFLD